MVTQLLSTLKMKKIKQTLYNVEVDDYPELRQRMVEELVDAELDSPMESLMAMLEELVTEMYHNMDDDSLQNHHDHIFGED